MSKLAKTLQAAAGNAGGGGEYVEDVFSTYLYTGNSTARDIQNDIDLDGEGGMAWIKWRSGGQGYGNHELYDTNRGATKAIESSSVNAEATRSGGLTAFNSDGFSLGTFAYENGNGNFASWTFRKSPKFFDVVTYTGDGVAGRTVAHNLGSVPGCVIVKTTSTAYKWLVYHKDLGNTKYIALNETTAATTYNIWNNTDPTSTNFTVSDLGANQSGVTYVAYLFAHDAGGFGDDGEQNVISCGSFTTDGSGNATVDLGYEPQWILQKSASGTYGTGNWFIADNMRGMPVGSASNLLRPNLSDAESSGGITSPTATGFSNSGFQPTTTYIYIAIRRPMKTPESGTEVFAVAPRSSTAGYNYAFVSNFPVDMGMSRNVVGATEMRLGSRLQGDAYLQTPLTSAEASSASWYQGDSMNSVGLGFSKNNEVPIEKYGWMFKRAPGFFDVVCYTGTDSSQTLNHNLGVAPEMIIVKRRNGGGSESWVVQHSGLTGGIGQGANSDYIVYLNSTNAEYDSDGSFNFSPTSTTFSLQNNSNDQVNDLSGTYIAYLFASCPGVSKVGSYTGNGTSQTIDCGFSAGARFVMVKRSSNSGSWLVFDSARGIVSGDDPYLQLNNTDAEVTNTDRVDPAASGFTVNFIAGSDVDTNVNDDTYIFLAIA